MTSTSRVTRTPLERALQIAEALGVIAAVAVAFAGQIALWDWVVEDSAISFAYARNLAEGWGLVRFPGDERVEAYSNPLWVFLMAGFERLGWDGFASSKGMALGLAALTVPATWAIGRQARLGAWGALLGALLVAVDPQFVIWSASGLENALFCALLALGMWRTHADDANGSFPWAALCFLGLAITRPEGIAYAAIGGAWALLLEVAGARRWARIFAWVGVFWGPFAVYHAIRYDYFAFPFPSTYYAKIGDVEAAPFAWNGRGWTYTRSWASELGRGWLLPVMLAGVIGLRGWRAWFVACLTICVGAALLYPGVEPFIGWGWVDKQLNTPGWWLTFRVGLLGAVGVLAPIAGLGLPGWRARGLAWWMAAFALFFALYSTGDWMRGYRWFSLLAGPMALLVAAGCAELVGLAGRLGRRPGLGALGVVMALGIGAGFVVPSVQYQRGYVPETSPWSVDKRVQHYRRAVQALHLDRVDILDHDMGAMVFWGGDLGVVRDSRGLVDIAFALHERQPKFIEEYAWKEYPFDLAHAHASTGAAVRMQSRLWRQDYIEMPGYGVNTFHTANFVKKSHLVLPTWDGPPERATRFAEEVILHGLDVPAPEVAGGSWLYLEFGLSLRPRPSAPIRLLAFLVPDGGGAPHTWDLPLGLEEWYPVTEWQPGEVFQGRVSVPVPEGLPEGRYTLGLAVIGPAGVLPAEGTGPGGVLPEAPVFARGEVWFPGAVEIVDRERMGDEAHADIRRAMEASRKLDCDGARAWWRKGRAHRVRSTDWQASVRPGIDEALATCFALRAERETDLAAAVDAMREARRWSRTNEVVTRVGATLGEDLFQDGLALRAAGDVEGAYARFRDTLYVDPSRSWARRFAEELRAERLGLGWN